MVVACDLARESGQIVVGPETKIACDKAIDIATKEPGPLAILSTAGRASSAWGHVWMGCLMDNYIVSRTDNCVPTKAGMATTFNTDGEMSTLAKMLGEVPFKDKVKEVILAVKWWHAPRSWCLCKYRLWKAGLRIPVSISWCPSNASLLAILREIPAFFQNILRILIYG